MKEKGGEMETEKGVEGATEEPAAEDTKGHMNSARQTMHIDKEPSILVLEKPKENVILGGKGARVGTYKKKRSRASEQNGDADLSLPPEKKRLLSSNNDVEMVGEKQRVVSQPDDAGLLEQSCENP